MVRKTKEEAERTYHALLDSAGKIFIRQGVAKTTLNEIATEAGLTRGAVYWHFKNKDAVIEALWTRNAEGLHTEFVGSLRSLDESDPVSQFRAMTKSILKRGVTDPEIGLVLRIVVHNTEFTEQETELQTFLVERKQLMTDAMTVAFASLRLHDALKSDLSDALLAHSFLSYIHGLLHTYYAPGLKELDLTKDGDAVMDLFLDAVLNA